jgi:hypothetical protein
MLHLRLFPALLPVAVAGLLACSWTSPRAGGVSVGIDIGLPALVYGPPIAGAPVGIVSLHYGGSHRGYYRGGWCCGWGLGLGLALTAPLVVPQTVVVEQMPLPLAAPPVAAPLPPSRPEPVMYPRNGQSVQQTEADRQECDRWATTLPAAMAEASVFHRAVEACMDGHGYTMK